MIIAFAVSEKDQDLALRNVKWWNQLGGCRGHQILFCWDQRVTTPNRDGIEGELGAAFDFVHLFPAPARIDGWPEGANYMFRLCATWMAARTRDIAFFMWMEPDAIPLKPGWLDKLEAEYRSAGKAFMGDRVEVHREDGDVPLHMSGVGIYQNPLYTSAGEAYRAFDIAWDMAGKDQIVPQAHFTQLIEHAWRHPNFTSIDELHTQIAPETILFHSSKDGSLIDLLRQNLSGSSNAEPAKRMTESQAPPGEPEPLSGQKPGSGNGAPPAQPTYDIFIRTYPGDYQWLDYCLKSISMYCRGFRKLWIVSPSEVPSWVGPRDLPAAVTASTVKVMNDETEDGYLAQQITKLYADVITDYRADYILHVDSDVIFTRPTTPQDFFKDGKLIWYYTPYSQIETPWQPITEKFMGQAVQYEFMRRFPMMMPRSIYPRLREFCHKTHGRIISEYIRTQPPRAFSEFNALGAYASTYLEEEFEWKNTLEGMSEPFAKQFHSWGGFTPEVKSEIEELLGGTGEKHLKDAPSVPTRIKVLPSGVWVLEGDQISQWVEQEGRLDHDQNLLPDILRHIQPGDTVVDAGAFIGDHTIAYSDAVGKEGTVHAFEPNPTAYQCLSHNLESRNNVILHGYGLSNTMEVVPLSGNNGNWGGAYIGEHMKITDVRVKALDTEIPWRVNFIKIDVEGYELKVLQGAGNLINRCRPKMVIEINPEALKRQGNHPDDIYMWLHDHGYRATIIQKNCSVGDPLYDILCVSKHQPPEISGAMAHTFAPPLVAASLTPEGAKHAIGQLKAFSESSIGNKIMVAQRLVYAGLRKPNPKKKKK